MAREGERPVAGRVALVTGGAQGIGRATAAALAAAGARVAIGDLDGELARRTAAELGLGVVAFDLDVTDREAFARVARQVEEQLGPIDVLVNNAAAAIYGPLGELTLKRRRLMFEVNVHAPVDLAQGVVPAMAEAGEGWIVNVSSRTSRPWPGPPFELGVTGTTTGAYGASKAALDRMTNALAAELAPTGIRVNAVAPRAAVMTEGAEALVGDRIGEDRIESLEHMVEAVVALCCGGPELTGRNATSHEIIDELGLAVRSLEGT